MWFFLRVEDVEISENPHKAGQDKRAAEYVLITARFLLSIIPTEILRNFNANEIIRQKGHHCSLTHEYVFRASGVADLTMPSQ